MHRHRRWCHEPFHLQIHAVCPICPNSHATSWLTLGFSRLGLAHVAEGGSLAEEVISTIRTAQAFGTQSILSSLYDVPMNKATKVDGKAAIVHGGGLAVFFFIIYASYGLGKHP